MTDKAAFVSAVLLCVQCYRGKRCFSALKAAPSAKEGMSINIFNSDQHEKTNKSAGYMLMFHFDINIERLEIHFKNDSFQTRFIESTLSFERQ